MFNTQDFQYSDAAPRMQRLLSTTVDPKDAPFGWAGGQNEAVAQLMTENENRN